MLLDEVDEIDANSGGWTPPGVDVLRLRLMFALSGDLRRVTAEAQTQARLVLPSRIVNSMRRPVWSRQSRRR